MDSDKITPLHRSENKFILDYILKELFPQAQIFHSAAETWLQIKKSYYKVVLRRLVIQC